MNHMQGHEASAQVWKGATDLLFKVWVKVIRTILNSVHLDGKNWQYLSVQQTT